MLILEREDKDMRAIKLSETQKSKIMSFLRTCSGIYVGNEAKTLHFMGAILWMVRTGSQWEALPERYGKWTTIYSRFQHWRKSAVWDKMFAELQTALDVESNVDWEIHFIDSTTVRAHQHAAGAKKVAQNKRL